jgi:hypothetical protein
MILDLGNAWREKNQLKSTQENAMRNHAELFETGRYERLPDVLHIVGLLLVQLKKFALFYLPHSNTCI